MGILSFKEIKHENLGSSSLYQNILTSGIILVNLRWSRVSIAQKFALSIPFTFEEIGETMRSHGQNKAPAPDWYTLNFLNIRTFSEKIFRGFLMYITLMVV